jgi:hypothetical protein
MSNKCADCQHELEGDGGCAAPCNLCSENDAIKFLLKHQHEQEIRPILLHMCNTLRIRLDDLAKVSNHFKEIEP